MNKARNKAHFVKRTVISLLIPVILLFSISGFAETPADSLPAHPQYQHIQVKIGFNMGLDSPYSGGLEFSFLFDELVDVNFGFGLGMSGAKAGIGTRIFPWRKKTFGPMAGVYFYTASGLWSMEQKNEESGESAVYRITADRAVMLNGGFRLRFGKGHYFIYAMGYSFPFVGEKAKYISGSTDPGFKQQMDLFATGGFSMTAGILLKLNRGKYLK